MATGTANADTTPNGNWSDSTAVLWKHDSSELTISTNVELAQLACLVNSGTDDFAGKTIRLTADIDLSARYWQTIGRYGGNSSIQYFKGTFDGQGHTISGVHNTGNAVRDEDTEGRLGGLFGLLSDSGVVRNVRLVNSQICGSYRAGGIVADNYGTIEGCYVGNDVVLTRYNNSDGHFGGVVGFSETGSTITRCVSAAQFKSFPNSCTVAGVAGSTMGLMKNCVYTGSKASFIDTSMDTWRHGPLSGYSNVHGLNFFTDQDFRTVAGRNSSDYLAYKVYKADNGPYSLSFDTPDYGCVYGDTCYAYYQNYDPKTTVTFTIAPNDIFASVTNPIANNEAITATNGKYTLTINESDYAITATVGNSGTGTGTADNPYVIMSADHWNTVITNIQSSSSVYNGKYYRLGADITVTTMMGTSTIPFSGTFDGNGHTLTVNYSVSPGDNPDYCGPFKYISNATIKNLVVSGTIQDAGRYYVSALVCVASGTDTIRNCVVDRYFKFRSSRTGAHESLYSGILYKGEGKAGEALTIEGCVFAGSMVVEDNYQPFFYGILYSSTHENLTVRDCLFDPTDFPDMKGNSIFEKEGESANYYIKKVTTMLNSVQPIYGRQAYLAVNADGMGNAGTDYGMVKAYQNGIYFAPFYYTVTSPGENVLKLVDGADNSHIIKFYHHQAKNVTISGRTLYKDGDWNTLCLPFDLPNFTGTPLQGAIVAELDVNGWYNSAGDAGSKDNDHVYQTGLVEVPNETDKYDLYLYFKEINSMEAGKPYLVKWTKPGGYDANPSDFNISDPTFTNVTVNNQPNNVVENYDGSVLFVPTFAPSVLEKGDWKSLYLTSANKLKSPSSTKDYTLNSFRGYFKLDAGEGGANNPLSRSLNIVTNIDDETATGLPSGRKKADWEKSRKEESASDDAWFDLQGRRIDSSKLNKGLYLHNSKKVIIK